MPGLNAPGSRAVGRGGSEEQVNQRRKDRPWNSTINQQQQNRDPFGRPREAHQRAGGQTFKDWQDEVDYFFARLQQIAPRAVRLYNRQLIFEAELPQLRRALEFWERENDKTVAALKRKAGIRRETQ